MNRKCYRVSSGDRESGSSLSYAAFCLGAALLLAGAVVKKIGENAVPEAPGPSTRDTQLNSEQAKSLREAPFQTDIPPLATLEALGSFKRSGIVRSRLARYGGTDWTRNILWMRRRFFVVVDDFVASEDSLFDVSVYWQTLGDVALDGDCFSVSQELGRPIPHPADSTLSVHSIATLHIKNTGGVTSSLCPDYGYGRFASYGNQRVIVPKQTKRARLKAGERIRIANLLYAASDQDSSKDVVMEIHERSDGAIVVKEGKLRPGASGPRCTRTVTLGVTDAPLGADGLQIDRGAFIIAGAYVAVAGARQASFQDQSIIDSDEPSATEILGK